MPDRLVSDSRYPTVPMDAAWKHGGQLCTQLGYYVAEPQHRSEKEKKTTDAGFI